MELSIEAELTDTLEGAAQVAVNISNLLNINVKFYYNRAPFVSHPGDTVASLIAQMPATPKGS